MAKPNKKRAAKRAKQKQADTSQQTAQPSGDQLNDLFRIRLTGRLKNTAPLHIGTGSLKLKDLDNADDKTLPILQVMRDQQGWPYIPGSSLRGLIRHHGARNITDNALFQRLFGTPKPKKDEIQSQDDAIQMGMLTVLDAHIKTNSQPDVNQRPRVSIDPVTHTAKASQLFALETLPEGFEFDVTFELEAIGAQPLTVAEMTCIANLLDDMSSANDLLLGKGKSIGQGAFTWTPENGRSIKRISKKDFIDWIADTSDIKQFDQLWKPETLPSRNARKTKLREAKPKAQTEQGYQSDWLTIPLSIFPQSAFLINANVTKPPAGEEAPAAVFQKNRYGQAEIPGSSLKGLFRAHCRKILLTLCDDQNAVVELIDKMFGSTIEASNVRVQSALSQQNLNTIDQYFNAIDRFTGGVKDTALYHVEAAYCQQLKGSLQIRKDFFKGNPWAQAVLIMLMRDAMEEDLAIGWGKNKGFGQTRFNWHFPSTQQDESTLIQFWSQLYEQWQSLNLLDDNVPFESLPDVLLKALNESTKEEA